MERSSACWMPRSGLRITASRTRGGSSSWRRTSPIREKIADIAWQTAYDNVVNPNPEQKKASADASKHRVLNAPAMLYAYSVPGPNEETTQENYASVCCAVLQHGARRCSRRAGDGLEHRRDQQAPGACGISRSGRRLGNGWSAVHWRAGQCARIQYGKRLRVSYRGCRRATYVRSVPSARIKVRNARRSGQTVRRINLIRLAAPFASVLLPVTYTTLVWPPLAGAPPRRQRFFHRAPLLRFSLRREPHEENERGCQ